MTARRFSDVAVAVLLLVALGILIFQNQSSPSSTTTKKDFDIAMTELQEGLLKRGYKIEKIQPVDKGLDQAGYKINNYRVIFYRDMDASRKIQNTNPEFTTLLPLTFTLIKEETGTRIISTPFNMLMKNAPTKYIKKLVRKWKKDSVDIIQEIKKPPQA